MSDPVYVVTSGEYDSYEIVAIFPDRQLAEDYAAWDTERRVEEYPVYDRLPERLTAFWVSCDLHRDGTAEITRGERVAEVWECRGPWEDHYRRSADVMHVNVQGYDYGEVERRVASFIAEETDR